MSLSLFQLVPAVYRLRDAQTAASMQLLTPAEQAADFVLQAFDKDQQAQLPNLYQEVNAILTEYVYGDQLPQETRTFLV